MTVATPSKIVCVGRNYAKHAAELGNDVPAEPLIFLKPPSSLVADGEPIVLPSGAGRVDYEAEIAVVIGTRARHVPEERAWEHVEALAPANDVTRATFRMPTGSGPGRRASTRSAPWAPRCRSRTWTARR